MNLDDGQIIEKYGNIMDKYFRTCSLMYPCPLSISFVRSLKWLPMIDKIPFDMCIFVPPSIAKTSNEKVTLIHSDMPEFEFTICHNYMNRYLHPKLNVFAIDVNIHASAIVGCDGVHPVYAPDGTFIHTKHMSYVDVKSKVCIGAGATIQRGVLLPTILDEGCYIDTLCNIGHQAIIGKYSIIASGAIIGGSCIIGDHCFVGLNATIKNGVHICDNVIIGQGSSVIKDIVDPGIYAGFPVRFIKPYDMYFLSR